MEIKLKRFILLFSFTMLSSSLFAQLNKFSVNIHIKGLDSGTVELQFDKDKYSKNKIAKSKMYFLNNEFTLKGELSYPILARLIINNAKVTDYFFIDSGNQQISLDIDSLSYPITVKGSQSNNEYLYDFQEKLNAIDKKIYTWYNKYWKLVDSFEQKIPLHIETVLQDSIKNYRNEMYSILYAYTKNHSKSYVALWELSERVQRGGYNLYFDKIYHLFDKKLQSSELGISLKKELNQSKLISEGVNFPVFPVLDSMEQKHYVSKKILKKYTLFDFWFSYCGPCIIQFDAYNKLYSKWHKNGFEIIGISVDKKKDKADWKIAINKYKLAWPQYWDISAVEALKLGIQICPTNYLVDSSGKIIAKNLEPYQVELFLQKNLSPH